MNIVKPIYHSKASDKTPKDDKKIDQILRKNGIIFLGGHKNGFARVKNEDSKENFITKNGKFLLKKWADNVVDFNSNGEGKIIYFWPEKKVYSVNKTGIISRE